MAEEVETEAVDETAAEIEKEPDAEKAPEAEKKEGTPDKALQKIQQEQAANRRMLEQLSEKIEAGQNLTPKEARKLDKVRASLKGEGFNLLDEGTSRDVSEAVVETADETESLKTRLDAALKRLDAIEGTQSWAEARVKFAGVDTEAVWEKAWTDAAEVAGPNADKDVIRRFASQMFRERCEAAKKRMDGAKPDKGKGKGGEAATYKVGTGQRPAPIMSEDDEALAEARSLVRIT